MQIKPVITEKTVSQTVNGNYTFRVSPGMTKPEIKKAVEKLFSVKVVSVRTAIMPGKKYRSGRRWILRHKTDWKKAVVTLKSGQKIDLIDVPGTEGK